ncbi:MAG: ferrous iron transport protein B, partial [Acetobacteraceae bacterium]
ELIGSEHWLCDQPPAMAPVEIRALQREARSIADEVILAEPVLNRLTRVLDKIVLHRIAGPIILAAILFFMFQAVFTWAKAPMDAIEAGFTALSAWLGTVLPQGWLLSLLTDGIIAGVGSVVVFLPQIVILFALILALEASGYMARAAFLMDELMLRVGLNGRAFIPLLSSFACAIPGMMAARTIENERDRLTTIMISPLMTCSARLPVYTLIIAAFIPDAAVGPFGLQGIVMFALYAMGIVSAVIVAWVLKHTVTRGPSQALMMELPTYKLPDPRDFFLNLFARAWAFLRRAGTIIFAVSVILWVLASFPESADSVRGSFAGMIGSVLEPVLRPIGFNLEIAIALVPGMAAREVAVGALGTVYAVQGAGDDAAGLAQVLSHAWTLPTALAFLAWYVYAPQCIASMAVARRETNSRRWTALIIAYLFALAYIAAGVTYWMARWAGL